MTGQSRIQSHRCPSHVSALRIPQSQQSRGKREAAWGHRGGGPRRGCGCPRWPSLPCSDGRLWCGPAGWRPGRRKGWLVLRCCVWNKDAGGCLVHAGSLWESPRCSRVVQQHLSLVPAAPRGRGQGVVRGSVPALGFWRRLSWPWQSAGEWLVPGQTPAPWRWG